MQASVGKQIHYVFFLACIHVYLAFACGSNAVLLIDGALPQRDNSLFIASWVLIHAAVLGGGLTYLRKISSQQIAIVVSVIGMCLVSTTRSMENPGSIIYSTMLLGNALCALVIARRIPLELFLVILHRVILVLVAISIVLFLLSYGPVLYIDSHERPTVLGTKPIRGLFAHKILGALYANLGLLITYTSTKSATKKLMEAALLLGFILLTGSSAGIVLALLGVFLVVVYSFVARRASFSMSHTAFLGIGLLGAFLVAPFFDQALLLLGRDATLTGRTLLWEWGLTAWLEKPFLGWGMVNYFDARHAAELKLNYASFSEYDVPHFHNSVIQTGVDFGAVGVLILAVIVIAVLTSLYRDVSNKKSESSFSALLIVAMLCLASTVMHLFFTYNHMATIVLLYLAFRVLSRPLSITG